jgi:hypothetical protein
MDGICTFAQTVREGTSETVLGVCIYGIDTFELQEQHKRRRGEFSAMLE